MIRYKYKNMEDTMTKKMTKKQYLTIYITIGIFIIIIAFILLKGNNKNNWLTTITKSNNYTITMKDCNDREVTLPRDTLTKISDNWNELSDNGPWTGNSDECYKTLTITYELNDIIETKQILLIDNTSLVLQDLKSTRYYTNSKKINDMLNDLFTKY